MDAACAFAENAVRTRYEDIPTEAIKVAKLDVLDTLGCALAGSSEPGSREIAALVRELGGREEATVIAYGDKVSALDACLANGAMADAHDYNDVHEKGRIHAGITTIPAALALAERMGGVSGKDFLTAIVLGADVVCRMGLANPDGAVTFILTSVYGFLGAAVTAGKLLGLDEEQMISAIGLAYLQAAGNKQSVLDGDLGKRMQAGFAARGGLLAALMSQKGITGPRNALEGKIGLYNAYHGGRYNPEFLTTGLGKHFEGVNLSFKPYPCCRFDHAHIEAALALAREHDIRADEIESISAFVNREPHSQFEPLEVKRNPRTIVDAQFSIPYTTAVALIRRRVTFDDFTPEAIKDPAVIGVANKVSPVLDLSLCVHWPPPAVLEVKTRRGTFTSRIEYALGHPLNPISEQALAEKFRDCAAHTVRPPAENRIADLIGTVGKLESLADVRELTELLV
jgi:2-methylcitrate dehydratase PrpD